MRSLNYKTACQDLLLTGQDFLSTVIFTQDLLLTGHVMIYRFWTVLFQSDVPFTLITSSQLLDLAQGIRGQTNLSCSTEPVLCSLQPPRKMTGYWLCPYERCWPTDLDFFSKDQHGQNLGGGSSCSGAGVTGSSSRRRHYVTSLNPRHFHSGTFENCL